MKYFIFLVIASILLSSKSVAQDDGFHYYSLEQLKSDTIKSDFRTVFANNENNYKKLRKYLSLKNYLKELISKELAKSESSKNFYKNSDTASLSGLVESLKKLASEKKVIRVKDLPIDVYNDSYQLEEDTLKVEVKELETLLAEKTKIYKRERKRLQEEFLLKFNLQTINNDIDKCEDMMIEFMTPENKQQRYRSQISVAFTILISLLMSGFFLIVYKRSDNTLSKELLSDNGLQFITIFVLVIAIILFGILGILEGRELSAILSGISGYILGRGLKFPKTDTPSK